MQDIDKLLLPFLHASGKEEETAALEALLSEHARPLATRILRPRLRAYAGKNPNWLLDLEDLVSEVILRLLRRVSEFKALPSPQTLADFGRYTVATTLNTFHSYLRKRYPGRWALKNKLRYILTHQKGFALWEGSDFHWLAGFTAWKAQKQEPCSYGKIQELRRNSSSLAGAGIVYDETRDTNPAEFLAVILEWAGAPVEFDDLVSIASDLWFVREEAALSERSYAPAYRIELAEDPREDVELKVEQRLHLKSLWQAIKQLPVNQRRALLLNLADAQGRDMITLIVYIRIADVSEVMETLEMEAAAFGEIWQDLPLRDNQIAASLGLSRQQVINLRSSARRTLRRHLRQWHK